MTGAMLAVGLGADEVSEYLETYSDRVVIACHNSPTSVTLSGDADAIDELKVCFQTRKIFAREVRTGGQAYHSHHMFQVANVYRGLLKDMDLSSNAALSKGRKCRMLSTVSNTFVDEQITKSAYWAANLQSPVLFNQAMTQLVQDSSGLDIIVEIGPHPALSGPIRQIFAWTNKSLSYLSTLKRTEDDTEQLLNLAGELWTRNAPIDISVVGRDERSMENGKTEDVSGSLLVNLPPYQWNYEKKYLLEPRQSREHRECKHPRHDVLGRRLPGLSPAEPTWRNVLRLRDVPWLKHHVVSILDLISVFAYKR